jgi:hypothetical protein
VPCKTDPAAQMKEMKISIGLSMRTCEYFFSGN